MTAKRFTVIDHNEWSEGDIIYYDDGDEMGWMDVCDKLNELHEENQLLKYKNEILSDELEQAKAVINKKWSEYLKKKELEE